MGRAALNAHVPRSLVLPAPAKLNRFLHVLGRRDDGYHELQTVFQLLDWGDRVHLAVRDDAAILRTRGLAGLAADEDLAVRAARLLQSESGCRLGADLAIDKRVPAGAGLGGGSSDAASVLLGLNALWRLAWSRADLAVLGLRLGADVPVFVQGDSAFAEGRGERLQPLPGLTGHYVVIWPEVTIATVGIFQAPELTRNSPPLTIRDLASAATRNDLEPVACQRAPVIAEALRWLSAHGAARMSGSGSSVFLDVADAAQAQALAQASPWPAWAVRGVARSPVFAALAEQGFAEPA